VEDFLHTRYISENYPVKTKPKEDWKKGWIRFKSELRLRCQRRQNQIDSDFDIANVCHFNQ